MRYTKGGVLAKVMTDLTQATLHEQSEERFHLLVDGVKEYAIYMLDAGGYVTTWNAGAERIKGYNSQEIIGRHFSVFFGPEDREAGKPEQILATARKDGRYVGVGTRVRKDGSRFTADVVITALRGRDGDLRGFAKVTRDITDRIKHEREVEQGSRRKDEFLAMLAHELRNPLAPIMSGLALLDEDRSLPASARQVVEIVQRQAGHLVRLLDDLLDVARIETGRISLQRRPVALQDVVALALEMTKPVIATYNHRLHLNILDEKAIVEGDIARLAQVIANLINNAAKFTDSGGNIWLAVRRQGNEAAVTVKVDGIGIPAQAIPRLFEMFYRGEHPPQHVRDGMGVGLSLVSKLVRLHGGSIDARSEGPGRGTEMIVRLPCTVREETPLPTPIETVPEVPPQRILVVDDNRDAGDSLAAVLRLSGHEVIAVTSGEGALSVMGSFRSTVMIIDIGMPKMNGNELAKRIRDLPLFCNIRLIALSGYAQEQDRKRSKEAGFDVHLVKPVDMGDLHNALIYKAVE